MLLATTGPLATLPRSLRALRFASARPERASLTQQLPVRVPTSLQGREGSGQSLGVPLPPSTAHHPFAPSSSASLQEHISGALRQQHSLFPIT